MSRQGKSKHAAFNSMPTQKHILEKSDTSKIHVCAISIMSNSQTLQPKCQTLGNDELNCDTCAIINQKGETQ